MSTKKLISFQRFFKDMLVYVLQPYKWQYFHTNLDKLGLTDSHSVSVSFIFFL